MPGELSGLTGFAQGPGVLPVVAVALGAAMLAGFVVHALRHRLAVILQSRLAAREALDLAFADTFWWALGFCAVAALGVTRLPRRRTTKVRGNA